MRTKDNTVETIFHPLLTAFLFEADTLYHYWKDEVVITSGSENNSKVKHLYSSLHYATPGQAADIRSWDKKTHNRGQVPNRFKQTQALKKKAQEFCDKMNIPRNWIDVILEGYHIHIEYQPKRIEG